MSNNIIKRAVVRLVRSEAFLEIFTSSFLQQLEQQLRQEAAGDSVYIPKSSGTEDKVVRDDAIRRQFTGNNIRDLSARWHLSEKQIRRITKRK